MPLNKRKIFFPFFVLLRMIPFKVEKKKWDQGKGNKIKTGKFFLRSFTWKDAPFLPGGHLWILMARMNSFLAALSRLLPAYGDP